MIRKISHMTILVDEQDKAQDFYVEKLGFEVCEDDDIAEAQHWVVVAPKGQSDVGIALLRADTEEKRNAIGHQAGDSIFMVLQTNDCRKTHQELKGKGVEFEGSPQERPWGMEVVFKDPYGNRFSLLQPKGWS